MEYPKITGMVLHNGGYINPLYVITVGFKKNYAKGSEPTLVHDTLELETTALRTSASGGSVTNRVELKFESPEAAISFLNEFEIAKKEALGIVEKTGPDRFIGSNSGVGAGR